MTRIAYNQGPQLAYWWFDRYVDFDDAQAEAARDSIRQWFDWHRANRLVRYADLLARMRRDGADGVGAARACGWFDEARALLRGDAEHALPALAERALRLTPAQIGHLERRYQRTNAELRADYLQPDPEARRQANLERVQERVEMLYGSLDPAQRDALAKSLEASPFDAARWLAERIERQKATLAALRRLQAQPAPTPTVARDELAALVRDAEVSPRPEHRAYQQRLTEFNCALAAQMDERATPEQRRHAAERLRGWEEDLRALAAAAPP